jgi:SSS family solute:Na+ symporter
VRWEAWGIGGYVLVMLGFGAWVSRRIKTDADFFLAGRSLGPVIATFSVFATWFGAETCIGAAGEVYREGLAGAHADPLAYGACIVLMGLFLARTLWERQITTIPDLFRRRWTPGLERAGALIMLPSSILWAGAQIRAFGEIISSTTPFDPASAITAAAVVVVCYTVAGGLMADAYNDLIQGIAIAVGLSLLLFTAFDVLGGARAAFAAVAPARWDLFHAPAGLSWWGNLERWLVPVVGSLVAQELVSRVVASRSAKVAVRSTILAAVLYLVIGSMPVILGLLGPQLLPGEAGGDALLPLLAQKFLPPALYVVFIGALIAAILSTVDSTLLAVSALATHNLIYPLFPRLDERHKVICARSGVAIGGLIAYGIAFSSESVSGLVETASGLGGPTILVMTLFALTRWGNHLSAWCAMVGSLIAWLAGQWITMEAPVLFTVTVGFLGYAGSLPFVSRPTLAPSRTEGAS